jgi:hypothetical protein
MTEVTSVITEAPAATSTSTPNAVADAIARRDALVKDKAIGAKYRAGDAATIAEVRALNAVVAGQTHAARVERAMAGIAPAGIETLGEGELSTSDLASAVDGLRKQGFADETIREIINGTAVTAERHREAENLREKLLRDKAWLREYRTGSREHIEQMHKINAVIAAPIAATK